MKIKALIIISILCFLLTAGLAAQEQGYASLSEESRFLLVTIYPGPEEYAAWGHSALVFQDPVFDLSTRYDYGTFTFDDPYFYVKFLQGYLKYALSKSDFSYSLRMYREVARRKIVAQEIRLTQDEKEQLYHFLEINTLEENRYYMYDFILDNCSTRITDALKEVLGDKVVFKEELSTDPEYTFRQLFNIYTEKREWLDFGIDLILGSIVDVVAEDDELDFLPIYLKDTFDEAVLLEDGQTSPLVVSEAVLLEEPPVDKSVPWYLHPFTIGFGLFFIVLIFTLLSLYRFGEIDLRYDSIDRRYGRTFITRLPDFFLFFLSGVVGVLLFYLWFISDHWVMRGNLNILWLSPLHILASLFLLFGVKARWLRIYFVIHGLCGLTIMLGWFYLPQEFNPAFIPYILLLVLRCFRIGFQTANQRKTKTDL